MAPALSDPTPATPVEQMAVRELPIPPVALTTAVRAPGGTADSVLQERVRSTAIEAVVCLQAGRAERPVPRIRALLAALVEAGVVVRITGRAAGEVDTVGAVLGLGGSTLGEAEGPTVVEWPARESLVATRVGITDWSRLMSMVPAAPKIGWEEVFTTSCFIKGIDVLKFPTFEDFG